MKILTKEERCALYEFLENNQDVPEFLIEMFRAEMPYSIQTGEDTTQTAFDWLKDRQDEIEKRFQKEIEDEKKLRKEWDKIAAQSWTQKDPRA